MRLDAELVRRGLARSRGHAHELLAGGAVQVRGSLVTKASTPVAAGDPIELATGAPRWVGRAAYKLAAALDAFAGLDVRGRRCLDVGASTGGFTQVLLERGARQVVALDVGHGQLAAELSADPRVVDRPGTNVRHETAESLGAPFDVVVVDLSFISVRLVLPLLARTVGAGGDLVVLVKPQFEVGRGRLGKGGVVTSAQHRRGAVREVLSAAAAAGLAVRGVLPSPLRGTTGNQEYLVWCSPGRPPGRDDIERLVERMEPTR